MNLLKRLIRFIGSTIKKYTKIVGLWRVLIAFIVSFSILYSPSIYGFIANKPEIITANVIFWMSPLTPAILIGIFLGILVLIIISPKHTRAELKSELNITGSQIKAEIKSSLDKFRNWLIGKDLTNTPPSDKTTDSERKND